MLNIIESKRQELERKYNEAVDRFDKYMKYTPKYGYIVYIVEEARVLYAIQLQLDLLDEIEEELEDMEDKE